VKVALVCNNFPPEFRGGTERVTLALATALGTLGEEVVVLSGSDAAHDGRDVIVEEGTGVTVLRVPRMEGEGYGLEIGRPRVLEVEERLLREHEVEVVHLHHWASLSSSTMRMARQLGLTGVVTLHDAWTTCPRFFRSAPDGITCPEGVDREPCAPCVKKDLEPVPLWKLRVGVADRDRALRDELAAAAVVTAPSESCASMVASRLPFGGPIEVVPHGLLEAAPSQPSADDAPGGVFRVGTFGNLVPAKGVALLVEAMAGLADAELHLFGPFLSEEFEREVRAAAAARSVELRCHGPYEPDGPHPALGLDLAVFPSLCEESYGLVVEEALARGVPVVVSDLGALGERVRGGGVVTRAGDADALRSALRELLDHPERYRDLRRGVPREFPTIEDAARRYVELYRSAKEVSA